MMIKKLLLVVASLCVSLTSLHAKKPSTLSLHKFNQHISGPKIDVEELKGQVVVCHQWQSHCGKCPDYLDDFERLARRKKGKAVFVIWHSFDKTSLAKEQAKDLKLKLPVYHGTFFNPNGWPNVLVYDREGKLVYTGMQGAKFRAALKKAMKS